MTRDRYLGILLMIAALFLGIVTVQIDYTPMTDDPGPKLFPLFACTILVLCGLGLLIQSKKNQKKQVFQKGYWIKLALVFAGLIAYGLMLWLIGFKIATPIMLFFFYWQMSQKGQFSLFRALIYTAITFAIIYSFFQYVLGSYLPEGILY
ncbi:tripartite tricarboxylate transporter TctB family protein [uncultured Cohaesibacter sp.]|uniref:tripartite tricarboxylate transporter TctB family protein n=1 Tax=uncultured Cohaesibacter sp. TaxID=1002546 RepID=UPI00292CA7E3|nr:tripartite tricarboxylate transporter TctB family protein [uncultured Cohaesibacter sp.]